MTKQLKWNKFPFYGDRLSANLFKGVNIARQRVCENHSRGTKSPD